MRGKATALGAGLIAVLIAGWTGAAPAPASSAARAAPGPAGIAPPPAACDGLERARGTMGTIARVVVCEAPDETAAAGAAGAALDAIDRVNELMSLYRPDSDLSRLNRDGRAGPVSLDPWLIELLRVSRDLTRETDGAFDVTIKPLMDHYGFYSEIGFSTTPGGLPAALGAVGIDGLFVDARNGTAGFLRDGMGVDAGGIAKGYALDRAAEALRERGIGRAIVELGRSFFFLGDGPAPGGMWPAAIVDPARPESVGTCLLVPPGSLSTSSPTGRLVRTPSGPVGHVLDPRRGAFESDRLQVTIWSPSGTRADALATAALILPPRKLDRLLARSREWALVLRRPRGARPGAAVDSLEYGPGRSFVSPCGGW